MSNLTLVLAIAAAGGLGAALRYAIDSTLTALLRPRFPWAIMLINLSGSFALGCLTGATLENDLMRVMAVGLLGGYTTFSTASLDSVRLLAARRYWAALLNGPGMLVACVALAALGIVLTAPA
jgi:CrcB protein